MKRILYVEDNEDTAEAVRLLLRNAGFDAVTAYSGEEALIMAQKEKYDLVLLDVMLPDMSGWVVFEKLKTALRKQKFAFLSVVHPSEGRRKELRKAGVCDYIEKPFNADDLIRRVRQIFADSG